MAEARGFKFFKNGQISLEVSHLFEAFEQSGNFYWSDTVLVRYAFITRACNTYVKQCFDALTEDHFPDVICVNSTFWDISRWDEGGEDVDRFGKSYFPKLESNVNTLCDHINAAEKRALQK